MKAIHLTLILSTLYWYEMRPDKRRITVHLSAVLACSCMLAFASNKKQKPSISTSQNIPLRMIEISSWENVTTPLVAGENHENHRGSAWCDFNNDGLLDVYLSHFGVHNGVDYLGSPNQLLQNIGNGNFIEITTEISGVGSDLSHHSAWADIDNDGLPDLFVGQSTNYGQDQNHLLHHDSVGVFSDITNGNPLAMFWLSPRGVSWQDVNLDGYVDLFISNSGGDQRKKRLMINQGDGTFVLAENTGLESAWKEGRGVAWCDFDNDGLADVYVVAGSEDNLPEVNRKNMLFKNNGDGTWTNVAAAAGVDDAGHGRGVAWGDINNDGYMDIIVGNQVGSDHPGDNKLYTNNGDGTFTDISISSGITENTRCRCVSMADYDNDGLLDLYTVTFGTTTPPNRLYHNNGDGTFTDTAQYTPASANSNGNSATWADFDNDGWIDLLAVGGSSTAPGIGQNRLLRNTNQNGNHWIEFELCGLISNRSAIGARVQISHRNENGELIQQMRDVQSGSGYNSQNMFRAHFGLGLSETIENLTIIWPSGIVQTGTNIPSDQILRIVESTFMTTDCNRNCVDDAEDIISGYSLDTNGNGIPDSCECLADFDNDGQVDVHDILALISTWEYVSTPENPLETDLNGDGIVNIHDLLILIEQYGTC